MGRALLWMRTVVSHRCNHASRLMTSETHVFCLCCGSGADSGNIKDCDDEDWISEVCGSSAACLNLRSRFASPIFQPCGVPSLLSSVLQGRRKHCTTQKHRLEKMQWILLPLYHCLPSSCDPLIVRQCKTSDRFARA